MSSFLKKIKDTGKRTIAKRRREKPNIFWSIVCPGQGGTIKEGMGLNIFLNSPEAREIIGRADLLLGRNLSHICFFGPKNELLKNYNAQPASLVINLAYAELLKNEQVFKKTKIPKRAILKYLAGYSVGYIATLALAGVVTFEQALQIITKRASVMTQAAKDNPGRMIVLIQPKIKFIEELILKYSLGGNLSSKSQVTLSGRTENMAKAEEAVKKENLAARVISLDTEGGLHSECMLQATEEMREFLNGMFFANPKQGFTIIGNTAAQLITTGEQAKTEASEHISKMVQWQKTMEKMLELGVKYCLEVGNGKVLTDFGQGEKVKFFALSSLSPETFHMTTT